MRVSVTSNIMYGELRHRTENQISLSYTHCHTYLMCQPGTLRPLKKLILIHNLVFMPNLILSISRTVRVPVEELISCQNGKNQRLVRQVDSVSMSTFDRRKLTRDRLREPCTKRDSMLITLPPHLPRKSPRKFNCIHRANTLYLNLHANFHTRDQV